MNEAQGKRRAVDGILLVDKPEGMTSNALLQRVKRHYRAAKAGHTGSLDPIATGLLPVCLGRATRICGFLLDAEKRYRAVAQLGTRTDTGDREGTVVCHSDPLALSTDALIAAIPSMLGVQYQIPPMYSALKLSGVPLYSLARRGIEVPREPRQIRVRSLRVVEHVGDKLAFEVHCSKGTYVRTLLEDWVAKVDQCAHLIALRRVGVGCFDDRLMVGLEQIEGLEVEVDLDSLLRPISAAFEGWPRVVVNDVEAIRLSRGQVVFRDSWPTSGRLAIFDHSGALLGVGEANAQRQLAPKRWFFSVKK